MADPRQRHQGAPRGVHQMVPDEQPPQAVGAFVQVRHRQIRRHGAPVLGPAPPDRGVGEKALVNPRVALLQFLRRHVFGTEYRVRRIVQGPIAVQQTPFGFHLPEQRRRRIRRKNVKCRALQTVLLDPLGGAAKTSLRS